MINRVPSGLSGLKMKESRFGIMLDDKVSKKLFLLAQDKKQTPYEYLESLLNEKHKILLAQKLKWDLDND